MKSNQTRCHPLLNACSFSISVIYPYFHISRSNTLQKQIYHLKGDSNEWLEQGVITQIDQLSSSSSAFAISDIEFVIFMGLRIDNDTLYKDRIGKEPLLI